MGRGAWAQAGGPQSGQVAESGSFFFFFSFSLLSSFFEENVHSREHTAPLKLGPLFPQPPPSPHFFLQVGRAVLLENDESRPANRVGGWNKDWEGRGVALGCGGRREVRKSSYVAPPNTQWPDLLGRRQPSVPAEGERLHSSPRRLGRPALARKGIWQPRSARCCRLGWNCGASAPSRKKPTLPGVQRDSGECGGGRGRQDQGGKTNTSI